MPWGTKQGRDDTTVPRRLPWPAQTEGHAFTEPLLVTENARMMARARLAAALIPAMAILSCLSTESWDPCVQVRVFPELGLASEKLFSAQFPCAGP